MENSSVSFATTIPIAHALWPETTRFLGSEVPWVAAPGNELQELMLQVREPSLDLALLLDERVLRAIAADCVGPVNKFLAFERFKARLIDAGSGANYLYLAVVMDLLGKFFEEGEEDYYLPKTQKSGFRHTKGSGLIHYNYDGRRVVEIPTKGEFSLFVAEPSGVSGWDMVLDWARLFHGMKRYSGNGSVLPVVNIEETSIQVNQLVGMRGGEWTIDQAVMVANFVLNRKMVQFKTAFAMSASRGLAMKEAHPGDFVADYPFLSFALRHNCGSKLPLATGLIPSSKWSG